VTETETIRPKSILIAALGGEGGGVLTDWLVTAATKAERMVQSTSIPGVAQRTGATTYYVEIWPSDGERPRRPLFALYPTPGEVDIMVASELVEAGRALQNGYVSPDRTLLVASTHRVFAMDEKIAMGDGRFDAPRVVAAARKLAKRPVLADLEAAAKASGAAINAVMLGAIARAGGLDIPDDAFRGAIEVSGKAVAANLAGFEAGVALADEKSDPLDVPVKDHRTAPATGHEAILERARAATPPALAAVLVEGVNRVAEYQGGRYARRYLDLLSPIIEADSTVTREVARETARFLALQMTYEDVIRVAQLKIKPERMVRVRTEIGAAPGQPVRVSEYLKPGLDEACALLPGFIARPILAMADRGGWRDLLNIGIRLNSASIGGFLTLKLLAGLRPIRRLGYRYRQEQKRIRIWLDLVADALGREPGFALAIASSARLIKGYGETFRRGVGNLDRIQDELVRPLMAEEFLRTDAASLVHGACDAALSDQGAEALDRFLASALATEGSEGIAAAE
jgi:indolepyruvate ferredoxin oxidoreductase beta subunit